MSSVYSSGTYTNVGFAPALNPAINGLIAGTKWGSGALGWGAAVTFSFPTSFSVSDAGSSTGAFSYHGEPDNGGLALSAAQADAARNALQKWANVANLKFTEITDTPDTNGQSGDNSSVGDIRFAMSNLPSTAWAYYPGHGPYGGDVWFNKTDYNTPVAGDYAYYTFMHEIGHVLGLEHPHENDDHDTVSTSIDSLKYSIMSYRDYVGDDTSSVGSSFFPTTPTLYDVLAIQALYGANWSYRSGNDVYGWAPGAAVYETIWDGGGVDTLSAANQTQNVQFHLTSGVFNTIGSPISNSTAKVRDNLVIAFNTTIENAVGSVYGDTIFGNAVPNVLFGKGGNDTLRGSEGAAHGVFDNDTLYGGDGGDFMYGHSGADLLYGEDGNDYLQGNEGVDLLDSGAGADTAYGGNGNDTIWGAIFTVSTDKGDSLYGEGGNDMIGGSYGNDTIDGGANDDSLYGDEGSDKMWGGDGKDLLRGDWAWGSDAAGADYLDGGNGNDSLYGGAGKDILRGKNGADLVDGGTGADNMDGGNQNDIYVVDNAGDVVAETFGNALSGVDTVKSSVTYKLGVNLENLILTGAGAISGTGNAQDNVIIGNSARNTLVGGSGNDTLRGAADNDILTGGGGSDRFEWTAMLFNSGDIRYGGVDRVTDFNSGDSLDFGAVFEALLRVNGAPLATSASNITLGNSFSASTNVCLKDGRDLYIDLDSSHSFTTSDYHIQLTGLAASMKYDAAADTFHV